MKAHVFVHSTAEGLAKEIEAWVAKHGIAVRHVGFSSYVLEGKVHHSALVMFHRGEDIEALVDAVEAWKRDVLGQPGKGRRA